MLKYTQLRFDHTARGKRVSELETETARLRRELRDRSEYGLHRHRGGRERGGRDRERDGDRAWDAERNWGGERVREKRQASPAVRAVPFILAHGARGADAPSRFRARSCACPSPRGRA
jgi:hypothetical protein